MNELDALILLTTIPYLGSIKIRLLIQHFGSALAASQASPSDLLELPGFGPKILAAWQQELKLERWRHQLTLAQQHGVQIIPYTSSAYPKRLLEILDYPIILYVKGTLLKNDARSLAIVGTRQASVYGMEMARKIGRELAEAGITVVSGFARGIDTAAHEGALETGRTIGVLGSGLGCLYPKENLRLGDQVVQQGALMSEFSILTPPDRQLFPQRNRIVCGMTMGTLLIEAPLVGSGAMITVEKALGQHRPVFALPGRADQENFKGNHSLIKRKLACLIENSGDILSHFDHLFPPPPFKPTQSLPLNLEPEEALLLQSLPVEELSIEQIIERTKLPIAKLNVLLMSLTLKKIIKEFPGKIYKKI